LDLLVRTGPDARRSVAAIVNAWRKRYAAANRAAAKFNASVPEDFQLSFDDVPPPAVILAGLKSSLEDTASQAETVLLALRKLGPKLAKIPHAREQRQNARREDARRKVKALDGHLEGVRKALGDAETFSFWLKSHNELARAGVYGKELSASEYRKQLQAQLDEAAALKKTAKGG
jgi:hypothetical protein